MAKSRAAATAEDVQLLRNEIARLLTVNLALSRQLEDLKRERTQAPVGALAAAMVQSLRSAQAALLADADGGAAYTVSQIDATFRGLLVPAQTEVALRLPVPEYGTQPGHLGAVRMTIAAAPPAAGSPSPTVTVPPSPAARMATALEGLQATMAKWPLRRGATAARDLVARTTQLLGVADGWDHPETVAESAEAMALTLRRLAKAVEAPKGAARAAPHRYQEAASWLMDVARTVRGGPAVSADALIGMAAAAEHATRAKPPLR